MRPARNSRARMRAPMLPRCARPSGSLWLAISLRSAVRLHLSFGDDARLEWVGEREAISGLVLLQFLVKPVPVHGGFKDHARVRPALHQRGKVMR